MSLTGLGSWLFGLLSLITIKMFERGLENFRQMSLNLESDGGEC